jgi:hypothetical protein
MLWPMRSAYSPFEATRPLSIRASVSVRRFSFANTASASAISALVSSFSGISEARFPRSASTRSSQRSDSRTSVCNA